LQLRSLVFPGNLPGRYEQVREAGFTAYRLEAPFALDIPHRDRFGLWRIAEGLCLEGPAAGWSVTEHVDRLRMYLEAAVTHGLPASLWFHPEASPDQLDQVVPQVFAYAASLRPELWVTTLGQLAQWMDEHQTEQPHAFSAQAISGS
jgi:hypothetical protein